VRRRSMGIKAVARWGRRRGRLVHLRRRRCEHAGGKGQGSAGVALCRGLGSPRRRSSVTSCRPACWAPETAPRRRRPLRPGQAVMHMRSQWVFKIIAACRLGLCRLVGQLCIRLLWAVQPF
jgi:hypothetical protein